jgi:hypothetical protein
MGSLTRFNLTELAAQYRVKYFIETGYGEGVSCKAALEAGFAQALSCEIFDTVFERAQQTEQLRVVHSDSITFLRSETVKAKLAEGRCLVFLDAHYPGADYGNESYRSETFEPEKRLPLLAELETLRGIADEALIVLDDIRIYRRDFNVGFGRRF